MPGCRPAAQPAERAGHAARFLSRPPQTSGHSRGETECGETSPQDSIGLSALLGVLQNDAAPMITDNLPFFDLPQGSKAAETGEAIVEAAISNARGLSGAVDITH